MRSRVSTVELRRRRRKRRLDQERGVQQEQRRASEFRVGIRRRDDDVRRNSIETAMWPRLHGEDDTGRCVRVRLDCRYGITFDLAAVGVMLGSLVGVLMRVGGEGQLYRQLAGMAEDGQKDEDEDE